MAISQYSKIEAADFLNKTYPIGAIYMSVSSTSPASLFGGTWEYLKDRFLVGAGNTYSNGTTGGEATHTLTTAEMPSHSHTASSASAGSHSHTASSGSSGSHNHTASSSTASLTGTFWAAKATDLTSVSGIVSQSQFSNSESNIGKAGDPVYHQQLKVDASHSHTITIDSNGAHTHSVSVASNGSHTHTVTVNSNGSGNAHNNLPPYLAVYMWKRTA